MSWTTNQISNRPMSLFMGGMKKASEIDHAISGGWDQGVNAFIESTDQLELWLDNCGQLMRPTYLSLTDGFDTKEQIDALFANPHFGLVHGIEVEASTSGKWTDELWDYLREKVCTHGRCDILYCYQTMWQKPQLYPIASQWKLRSGLWYPYFNEYAQYTYHPDWTTETIKVERGVSWGGTVYVRLPAGVEVEAGDCFTLRCENSPLDSHQVMVKKVYLPFVELIGAPDFDESLQSATLVRGSGGSSSKGRTAQISVPFDTPLEPIRQLGAWASSSPSRRFHVWLQAYGQEMSESWWDDSRASVVAPGVGRIFESIWSAHIAGADAASFYTYRNGVWDNFHNRTKKQVSYDLLPDVVDAATGRKGTTWKNLKEAVAKYMEGPGHVPTNSNGAWGYRTPFVGVVTSGQ